MADRDHELDFSKEAWNRYHVRLRHQGLENEFCIRLIPDVHIAASSQKLANADIAFDLLDLAVAIYAADWHSKRVHDMPSELHINLSVRCPQVWQSPTIIDRLVRLLHWYTEDNWRFSFSGDIPVDATMRSRKLPLSGQKEVALWSSGLDSFAGLVQRFRIQTADEYLLFGTGSNDFIHARQGQLIHGLREIFGERLEYQRLQIRFEGATNIPNNSEFRSRGFVYILLGAAISYLEEQDKLYIYENGIGAINLPLSAAEVGLDHARSVHPISLYYIEAFLCQLLGKFRIINPFWDQTKGQMCLHVASEPALRALACQTVSCDRLPRTRGRQCGYCTSCLLRREAFLWAGIGDNTIYGSDVGYFVQSWDLDLRAVLGQLQILRVALDQQSQAEFFREFVSLNETSVYIAQHVGMDIEIVKDHLYHMYAQYVSEWEQIESNLTNNLMSNARHPVNAEN